MKDDEKIDADAILGGTDRRTEALERRAAAPRLGAFLHITGWNIAPAYNSSTKRLEWATALESQGQAGVNFFIKDARPSRLYERRAGREPDGDARGGRRSSTGARRLRVQFGRDAMPSGSRATRLLEYGLAGLIVGGAAAAAVKSGLFKGLWKILLVGGVAILAGAASCSAAQKSDA